MNRLYIINVQQLVLLVLSLYHTTMMTIKGKKKNIPISKKKNRNAYHTHYI